MLLGCAAPACYEVRGDITVCEVNRDKVRVRRDVSCPVRNALHEDDPHALPLDLALQLQHSKIRAHTLGSGMRSRLGAGAWAYVGSP